MTRLLSAGQGGETPVAQGGATLEIPATSIPAQWRIRLLHRGRERLRILHQGETLTIGSSPEAGWTLDDPTVSALHCRLLACSTGLVVSDLGSRNGVFVGGGRVREATLSSTAASFTIGETSIVAEERRRCPAERDLGMVGSSEPMLRLREQIRKYAGLAAPVLVLGESGTGKDLVARALHQESGREGEFVPLNVAAMPESLLDAELFGHVRGAFTGADASRRGAFEEASNGTLFLDEMAEMSMLGQSKLLRVVEDGIVRAVGATKGRRVEVRLVAATCAPLLERVEQDRFRHDLYHRLSTLVIRVPPLRQRRSDIPQLVDALIARIAFDVGPRRLTPSALTMLCEANWPGNVRQLLSTLYRAAVDCPDGVIGCGHLAVEQGVRRTSEKLSLERALELLTAHGSVSAAARAARVPRSTFRSVVDRGRKAEASRR